MNFPALLSFICGFTSLSLEILWVRLYGFAKLSTPAAFGFVLMSYLVGIAFGAHFGSKACRRGKFENLWNYSIGALLLSAACTVLLPKIFANLTYKGHYNPAIDLAIIAISSFIIAFVFPIAHHLGSDKTPENQGRKLATVYTANVIGGALGPLATGYLLLDYFTLQQSFYIIASLQLTFAAIFSILIQRKTYSRIFAPACSVLIAYIFVVSSQNPHSLIQQLASNGTPAKSIIENRHGVITIFPGSDGDDSVYGGNVYDGRTNLNPDKNTNGLHRPLLLTVLQPEPKRVLMIGLSIGTWLALINEFTGVEHVDVIEINPGYISAAEDYPHQKTAINDPRVRIIINDARRWLRLHPDAKYDMVIMNTTWNWRSNASLLLSEEFLKLVKSHMKSDAILAFNSTGSGDAFYTASSVFDHAYRYDNFIFAGNQDFREKKNSNQALEKYKRIQLQSTPLFSKDSTAPKKFLERPFVTIQQASVSSGRTFEIVTDQNMITEFKYGRALY